MVLIPGIPLWFMAFGVGLMTPVPYPIAYALIGGLSADSVVKHPEALKTFPEVTLIDFDSAARDALKRTHPSQIERVWEDGRKGVKSIKHEGCFIDRREARIKAEPHKVFSLLEHLVTRSTRYKEILKTEQRIIVCVKKQPGGEKWIEWQVRSDTENMAFLSQTTFFCPHGLPGFLYAFFQIPLHKLRFRRFMRQITTS
jgi:hypothetical protein